ncbi:MAG TPA: CHAD domain-containing protein [Longimicrobiaceae bacterium]|nr:CHAD domain-containing protein [Longimicrobiaceae bacterium]
MGHGAAGDARAGADRILRAIEGRDTEAEAGAGDASAGFRRVRRALQRQLATMTVAVEEDAGAATLASLLADRVDRASSALARHLARACEETDPEAVHRARLAVKRLRYLLEPFAAELDGAPELIARLRALQETTGSLHDGWLAAQQVAAHVLLAPDDEPDERDAGSAENPDGRDLAALASHLAAEQRAGTEALRARCTAGEVDALTRLAARVAAAARARGRGNLEIERKYLLRCFPVLPEGATQVRIAQGWIAGQRLHERIRRVRYEDGGERWFRTVKLGTGVSRTEVEEEAPAWLGRRLWLLTRGRRVHKWRWSVPHGGLVWEIDRFTGRPLVLAEVEIPRADHRIEFPEWLRPCLDREVTGDPTYVNLNLAR